MAQKTLVMGESGTGKSTSLRNLDPEITAVINPVGKPLPFKSKNGRFTMLNNEIKSANIVSWMKGQVRAGKKILIVDDFQYLLSVPYMNRIHEGGWDKWNDFGDDYFRLIDVCADLPADVRVYYLTHCETLDNGITTIKLIGKLLREKITIEGLFTIVLRTSVIDQKYYFLTQNSGKDTVKSPMGMFEAYAVENDLAYIDDKICNYYEIGNYKTDKEMTAEDQKAAGDIQKPDKNGRRARGTAGSSRKSRSEVEAENSKKMGGYIEQTGRAIDEAAGEREEIPFDEAAAVAEKVAEPELEKPPRRTRRERDCEPGMMIMSEDAYFYDSEAHRYWIAGKGDKVSERDVAISSRITKEQYEKAVAGEELDKIQCQEETEKPKPRQRKSRDIQPAGEAPAETPQQEVPAGETAGRSRRIRRTR